MPQCTPDNATPFHPSTGLTYLTSHFSVEELSKTNTGIPNIPPDDVVRHELTRTAQVLELCRAALGVALIVSSGYRCRAVNAAVGGVSTSAHVYGRAADFAPQNGWTLRDAFDRLRHDGSIPYDQIILEPAWVHIGIAPQGVTPRRQMLHAVPVRGRMTYEVVQ